MFDSIKIAITKTLRIQKKENTKDKKCHDPSLARLSLLALPGLSSLRHLD